VEHEEERLNVKLGEVVLSSEHGLFWEGVILVGPTYNFGLLVDII